MALRPDIGLEPGDRLLPPHRHQASDAGVAQPLHEDAEASGRAKPHYRSVHLLTAAKFKRGEFANSDNSRYFRFDVAVGQQNCPHSTA